MPRRVAAQPEVPELSVSQLNEQVYDLLKAEIIRGNLRPRQRLTAAGLASRLGVSATPVRDALQRLSADGLVEVAPRRGTVVSEFTAQNVRETFQARRIIECAAVAQAPHAADSPAACLAKLLEGEAELRRGDSFADYGAHLRLDAEFHRCIVGMLQCHPLSEFHERLRWPEQVLRGLSQSSFQRAEATVAEHRAIYVAIAGRDADRAREAVLAHLDNAEADLLRRLPSESKP